jgi:ATPase subunit of ABC transporter with duplicated ATPase domains
MVLLRCCSYGLVGRNGTGKTTLLRALSGHQIRGTPPALQILHVEQEVHTFPG